MKKITDYSLDLPEEVLEEDEAAVELFEVVELVEVFPSSMTTDVFAAVAAAFALAAANRSRVNFDATYISMSDCEYPLSKASVILFGKLSLVIMLDAPAPMTVGLLQIICS